MKKLKQRKMTKKPTVIDFFCGAGGLSEGFKQAGFDVIWASDFEEKFCKTHELNHPCPAKVGDIRNIKLADIKKDIKQRVVDVVVGGPPCQGFSHAGMRDPKDPRNSLFMEFVRLVGELNPKWVVMENVPGILTMKTEKGENVASIIQKEFQKKGYNIKPFKLISADYGVPQKRKRIFFMGTRTKKEIEPPERTHSENPEMNISGKKLKKWVSVKEILLPKSKVSDEFFHSERMIAGFNRRKEKHKINGNGFGPQYLNLNKPSYTLSARYWKDGSDALVKYSEDEIRMLTPLEAARIQGFPDNYKFYGSKRYVYTQIGNAVSVNTAKAVAEKIKEKLNQ